MTSLKTAGQLAAAMAMGTALFMSSAMGQSSGSANTSQRGLDFRLPPADDGRDSNVQGPADNGLPPRQDRVITAPVPQPKTVTPPKIVPTIPATKAAPAAPKTSVPTSTPKAVPAPAPKQTAPIVAAPSPVAASDPMVTPTPETRAPNPDPALDSEIGTEFLPAETGNSEADRADGTDATAKDNTAKDNAEGSPWWAWPLAALIALVVGALYWRRQTAIRPEDYLEAAPTAQARQPNAPAPQPKAAGTPPSPAVLPVSATKLMPAAPVSPLTAAPPAQRPAPAPVAEVTPRPTVAPPSRAAQPPVTPPPISRPDGILTRPASRSTPAATPVFAPQSTQDSQPEAAVPAWRDLDTYVSAGSLGRRPAKDMRADVDMDIAVRSIRIETDHIAVGFTLTLSNIGLQTATGLMVRIALDQGSAMSEVVLGRFYDGAGGSILRDDMELGSGRSEQLSSEVKLPRTSVEPMILAGKPLLVPVLAADITYHWDGDGDAFGQIAGAYVLGRAAVGASEKLAPIPMDRAPFAVDRPGARATDVTRRQ